MISEDQRLFLLVDEAFEDAPERRQPYEYSLTIIRAVCQMQSDEALDLARRCGVEVP